MANCFSRNAKISETFICRLATWVVRLFPCFSLQTIIAGAIPPKRGCFVSACRTAMTPFFVLREEKSLAKVYEKKLIFCFISICQAENRPRRRMQQSGTVTETKISEDQVHMDEAKPIPTLYLDSRDWLISAPSIGDRPGSRRHLRLHESEDIVLVLQTVLWR